MQSGRHNVTNWESEQVFLNEPLIIQGSFMKKTNKLAAKFSSEDKERRFWAAHSALDYLDTSRAKNA